MSDFDKYMEQLIWAAPDAAPDDDDNTMMRIPTHDGPVKRDKDERKRQKTARRKSRK